MKLHISQLRLSIGERELARIDDWMVASNQMIALLGPNGAGKTTLLHTLAGLRSAQDGTITLDDRPLSQYSARERAQRIAVLLQDTEAAFPGTVFDLALSGRFPHAQHHWYDTADDYDAASTALELTGIAHLAQRDVRTLSGGERRRAAIAAMLAQHAPLMILDEIGNHLDIKHHVDALDAIRRRVREHGGAAIFSMHDINMARQFCDQAMLMFGTGEVVHGPCTDVLTETNLSRLYGQPMMMIEKSGCAAFVPRILHY